MDGERRATFSFEESLREDASAELDALRAMGHKLWVVSGDSAQRVQASASRLNIKPQYALASQSPAQKHTWVKVHPKALFIGDGLNDSLALSEAFVSGAAAVERPHAATRADFFFF